MTKVEDFLSEWKASFSPGEKSIAKFTLDNENVIRLKDYWVELSMAEKSHVSSELKVYGTHELIIANKAGFSTDRLCIFYPTEVKVRLAGDKGFKKYCIFTELLFFEVVDGYVLNEQVQFIDCVLKKFEFVTKSGRSKFGISFDKCFANELSVSSGSDGEAMISSILVSKAKILKLNFSNLRLNSLKIVDSDLANADVKLPKTLNELVLEKTSGYRFSGNCDIKSNFIVSNSQDIEFLGISSSTNPHIVQTANFEKVRGLRIESLCAGVLSCNDVSASGNFVVSRAANCEKLTQCGQGLSLYSGGNSAMLAKLKLGFLAVEAKEITIRSSSIDCLVISKINLKELGVIEGQGTSLQSVSIQDCIFLKTEMLVDSSERLSFIDNHFKLSVSGFIKKVGASVEINRGNKFFIKESSFKAEEFFRSIKEVFEEKGAEREELFFNALESKAHWKSPTAKLGFWGKVIGWIANLTNNFGADPFRPIGILLCVWLVFAVVYLGLGVEVVDDAPLWARAYGPQKICYFDCSFEGAGRALHLSFTHTFFGPIAWLRDHVFLVHSVWGKLVSTVHLFVSIVLLYLAVTGMRKVFRQH